MPIIHRLTVDSDVIFFISYVCLLISRHDVGQASSEDVCKTVRRMLSVRCLSCLSVCNVRALWLNGWTDQEENWQAGRPRPWPRCVRWWPSSPSPKGTAPTQFSAHVCCSKMAAWIKMPLGMEQGLSPGDFVLDGDPLYPPQKRGQSPLPNFRPISIVAKRLHAWRCHLVWR